MAVVIADYQYPGAMSLKAEDGEDPAGDGSDSNKRSERKRQREKQRRSDLSNAFDELAAFIVQVEPESADVELDNKKKRKKSGEGEDSSGITRLDLIGRAVKIMERLHRENEERKRVIKELQNRGGPSDNVLVLVPNLAQVAEESYPVARASYPPSYTAHSGGYYQNPAAAEYSMQLPPSRAHSQYPPSWSRYGPPPHNHGQGPPHSRGADQRVHPTPSSRHFEGSADRRPN